LYENGEFYWVLDTIGEGKGKWTYDSKGYLKLISKTYLFYMIIKLYKLKEDHYIMQFRDRHGMQNLPVEFFNLNN